MPSPVLTASEATKQLDDAMSKFHAYVNGVDPKGPTLRQNWDFLQIFSVYGLRLPSTAAALQAALGLTGSSAATYTWFGAMVEGYQQLKTNSEYFYSDVFTKVTELGNGVVLYAKDVAGEDSEFTLISTLVQPGDSQDLKTALELLEELKTTAIKNATLAAEVKLNLTTYKTSLVESQGALERVKDKVESDDRVSTATIAKLSGSKEKDGSLLQLQGLLAQDLAEYNHDVVVASTSVTYSWVVIPFPPFFVGLIAAATVAGVFGKKAAEMLETVHTLEGQIATANAEMQTALAVQHTTHAAEDSLSGLMNHLEFAITSATTVYNAWDIVITGLGYISDKISSSMRTNVSGEEQLVTWRGVEMYMDKAHTQWTQIQPTIEEMTKNPMIDVELSDVQIGDFIKKIEDHTQAS